VTAQIEDSIIWKESIYSIVSLSFEIKLFDPRDYNIEPVMISTGCYRGFYSEYNIVEGYLYLFNLNIKKDKGRYHSIKGVKPELIKYGRTTVEAKYSGLMLPIRATGTIRIAKDFISDRHVNMGFQEAISYKTVKQLYFCNGKLQSFDDLSNEAEILRKAQSDVKKFLDENWVSAEWEDRLRSCYGFIDPDDISRTFTQYMEPLYSKDVYKILAEIKKEQTRPRWLIINYADYYIKLHQYYFEISHMAHLGCSDEILNFLQRLKSSGYTEQHVILAFLETLRVKIVGNLWGEGLHYITDNQYTKANIEPMLRKVIEMQLSGVTLDSWS